MPIVHLSVDRFTYREQIRDSYVICLQSLFSRYIRLKHC